MAKKSIDLGLVRGAGIKSIELKESVGLVDTYEITFDDGNTIEYDITNGEKGDPGDTIESVVKSSTSGLVDTYNIVLSSGEIIENAFTVTNGTGAVNTVNPEHLKLEEGMLDLSDSEIAKFQEQIDSGFLQSKNLFDKNTLKLGMWGGEIGSTLSFNAEVTIYVSSDIIEVKPNTTYYVSGTSFDLIFEADANKTIVATQSSRTFTTSATTKYLAIRWRTSSISEVANSNVQVEVGDVPTNYVEGNGKSNRELTKIISNVEVSEDLPYGVSYVRVGNLVQLIMENQVRNITKNSLIVSGLPQPYEELILKSYLTADGKLPTFQLKPNGELRTDDVGVNNIWCASTITYICK